MYSLNFEGMEQAVMTIDFKERILRIRGEYVILDKEIAQLYGVTTSALNQAVKRNINRFPTDFMFQLTVEEFDSLKSQIVTAKPGRGGSRNLPYAFTEHGVLMLASVLKSDIAALVSINIARTFAEMRRYIAANAEISADIAILKARMDVLERSIDDNTSFVNDISEDMRNEIQNLYQALADLVVDKQIDRQRNKIGYKTSADQ
jgi:hypothetical protein